MLRETTSLTAPADRASTARPLDDSVPPLTDPETMLALTANTTKLFPRTDRKYADPPIDSQRIALFSFVAAKGATPDSHGMFGMAKIRGSFGSEREADQRAEFLVKSVDSFNRIFHTYVGRPFPITASTEYTNVVKEVDGLEESLADEQQSRHDADELVKAQILERERKLADEVKRETADTLESYTTLRVKHAQLKFTFVRTRERLEELKQLIKKGRAEIAAKDEATPELSTKFLKKLSDARNQVGLVDDASHPEDNFIRFLGDDITLDLD